ncbi:MAG: hypothetical protein Q8J69_11915 [Sphingobacteriaceae bacterium]|nr:hypothetical protein [Sphingobacteriaceae bacterium]
MPDAKKTRALPAWAAEMQAESQLLDLTQPRVWVENEVLGVQEGLDTNVVAWESVYAFFLDAAVQEEAMQTGYAFEKTVGLSDSVLEWTAEKRNRRPQLLRLIYSRTKGELLAVQIENETDNMFYKSAQSLRYAKGDSILIVGMNQLRWQERKSYRQMIRF